MHHPEARGVLLSKDKGDRADASAYRNLSVFPAHTRLMDSCVADRLQEASSKLFTHSQYGFIRGCNTWFAALHVYMAIAGVRRLYYGDHKCLILLLQDQAKAYDRVNHGWLLHALYVARLPQKLLWYFECPSLRSLLLLQVANNLSCVSSLVESIPP